MKKIVVLIIIVMSCFLFGCSKKVEDGAALLKEEKYEEAIKEFQKSVDKKKDLDEAYRGQGIAYWELEEYEKASDCFIKALNNGAKKTGTIFNFIAIGNMKLGNFSDALNYFNLGLSMEDSSEELIKEMKYNEIVVYESMKDWESAKTKIAEYIAQYPDDEKAIKEAEFLETR